MVGQRSPAETSPLVRAPASVQAAAAESTPMRKAGKAIVIGLAHIVCSAAMILFNKYLLNPARFPHSIALTTMHMFTAFLFANVLRRAWPQLLPSCDHFLGRREAFQGVKHFSLDTTTQRLWPFVPIGVCFAGSVMGSNTAFLYASVPFLQMVKESMVLWVYLLMVLFGMDALKMRSLFILCLVAFCAAIAINGEIHFLWLGLFLQLFASMAQAMQAVLTGRLMSHSGGPKVDPMTMVLLTSPVCLAVMLPINYLYWSNLIVLHFQIYWKHLFLNCILAFGLNVVNAITIKELSATGLALAAVMKDLTIVGSAAVILGETITHVQVVGFTGSVFFIALYSATKLFPAWFERAAAESSRAEDNA